MIRGIVGLALIGACGLFLYVEAFLNCMGVWITFGSMLGLLAGCWLLGSRKFDK